MSPYPRACSIAEDEAVKWVKNFFGLKDIRAARKRLDRLMQEEDRMVAAQTLGLVDGEQTPSACNPLSIEILPRREGIH